MFTLVKQFKREFVYSSYLFLVLELLVTRQYIYTPQIYLVTLFIGLLLILSWFTVSMKLFGRKKISKKTSALLTIDLSTRMFPYIIMPIVLWLSVGLFLFFNENVYITQSVIVASVVLFFLLMLRIRSSFEKIYSVDSVTRFVYDFINIFIFYILLSVLNRVGFSDNWLTVVVFLFCTLSFHHMLYIHRKMGLDSTIVSLACAIIITATTYLTQGLNIYMQPAIVSSAYYLIVALWNVRFSGSRRLDDYIPPVMYTLMAIILILSL